jgi:hypothetical protein
VVAVHAGGFGSWGVNDIFCGFWWGNVVQRVFVSFFA